MIVMQLHALALQASGTNGAKTKTASQELQPDRGKQRRGLESAAPSISTFRLAALLFHAGDQHHNLMECFQTQLERQNTSMQ